MSNLSAWLAAHVKIPQVNLIPEAEQLAKVVANEVLDKNRAAILAELDAAQAAGDTLIDTSDTAIKAFVDAHLSAIPGIPESLLVLVQNFVESYNTAGIDGEAKAKLAALIADVKQKVSSAQF